jgi:hypothetical protein
MPLYFAYGSNMNQDQMRDRCPDSKLLGKAVLPDHKLAFTRFSSTWDSAVADILVFPGHSVWGMLYEISKEDLEMLDRKEGHPRIYQRKRLTVNRLVNEMFLAEDPLLDHKEFEPCEAEVYEVVRKELGLMPKLNYLRPMLDAAFYNGFPANYQRGLHEFGDDDYHQKLGRTLDFFISLEDLIKKSKFPDEVKKQKEWGGANLVITGSKVRKEQLNRDYPHELVVLTKHWRELSWLLEKIYNNEHIIWQIDADNKYHLLSEMGQATIDHMLKYSNETSPFGICLSLLHAGYRVVTSDFYKEY